MMDWRAAVLTSVVELGLAAGGQAALMPAMWGLPDDFPLAGECFGRNCTTSPARLAIFDIPSPPPESDIGGLGIVVSELCPAAAGVDRLPQLIKGASPARGQSSWYACLRIDATGRVEQVGQISDAQAFRRANARRFVGTLRFLPALTAGRPTATWIRLQVRAEDPIEPSAE